jgi:hypothetical protein
MLMGEKRKLPKAFLRWASMSEEEKLLRRAIAYRGNYGNVCYLAKRLERLNERKQSKKAEAVSL